MWEWLLTRTQSFADADGTSEGAAASGVPSSRAHPSGNGFAPPDPDVEYLFSQPPRRAGQPTPTPAKFAGDLLDSIRTTAFGLCNIFPLLSFSSFSTSKHRLCQLINMSYNNNYEYGVGHPAPQGYQQDPYNQQQQHYQAPYPGHSPGHAQGAYQPPQQGYSPYPPQQVSTKRFLMLGFIADISMQ
jgi:hypothetical protein